MKSYSGDFPILADKNLTYFDSAATSLKPQVAIDAMNEYYTRYSANIHRGMYPISERASAEYEETREVVADFIHAPSPSEIIFTRNTTEAINLVAYTQKIEKGDEIVTTVLEHHANFVPWQQLAFASGADLKVIDCDDTGDLQIYDSQGEITLENIITGQTKIFAIQYVSNVLGTIHPLKKIIAEARRINSKIIVVVDAAQAAPHIPIDVQDLDCDFLAFSAHKMCGPTGVGILWGRAQLLNQMPPFLYGGDMIEEVFIDHTTWAALPNKFEAGTPDIAGVIGLKTAILYLQKIGMENLLAHESQLGDYLVAKLHGAFGNAIMILGEHSREPRVGVAAFTLRDCHSHDIAGFLAEDNVCIRAGYHCAMPLHTRLKLKGTSRASVYLYNTEADVDKFITSIKKAYKLLTNI